MENEPFEDVFPIERGDIPASYVSLPEGTGCGGTPRKTNMVHLKMKPWRFGDSYWKSPSIFRNYPPTQDSSHLSTIMNHF